MAIVTTNESNQDGVRGASVTASGQNDGQKELGLGVGAVAATPVVVAEGDEAGAGSSEGDRPRPYMSGWRHIFNDTQLKNEKER